MKKEIQTKFEAHIKNDYTEIDLPDYIKEKIIKFASKVTEELKKNAEKAYTNFTKQVNTKPDKLKLVIKYSLDDDKMWVFVTGYALSKFYGQEQVYHNGKPLPWCSKHYSQELNQLGLEIKQFFYMLTTLVKKIN